jgi:hypothetical protein
MLPVQMSTYHIGIDDHFACQNCTSLSNAPHCFLCRRAIMYSKLVFADVLQWFPEALIATIDSEAVQDGYAMFCYRRSKAMCSSNEGQIHQPAHVCTNAESCVI